MRFYPHERTGLFIDGPNLSQAMRGLGWEMDYRSLQDHFAAKVHLVRCAYYTAVSDGKQAYISLKPVLDYLEFHGWRVVSKSIKEISDDATGQIVRKGNMDVEIAVDMMRAAQYLDHLVLFSGDGDFRCLVQALQDIGKRVTVCGTRKGEQRSMADELRRQADDFIELDDLKPGCQRARQTAA